MRTTLREKAVLWVNGLALAAIAEFLLERQQSPLSLTGIALIAPLVLGLALFTLLMVRRPIV